MTQEANEITIKVGDWGKGVNTFIERLFDVADDWLEPINKVRHAKADAKVAEITLKSQQATSRTQARFNANRARISARAIPLISDDADPNSVSDDWFANFFEKAKLLSDDNMQGLWSRILAGEVNRPGRFSRRAVNWLADFDRSDAEAFSSLCRCVWRIDGDLQTLVFEVTDAIYTSHGIDFRTVTHLESIGAVHFVELGEYSLTGLPEKSEVFYGERRFELMAGVVVGPDERRSTRIHVGRVDFTRLGRELATLVDCPPIDGFVEYVKTRLRLSEI